MADEWRRRSGGDERTNEKCCERRRATQGNSGQHAHTSIDKSNNRAHNTHSPSTRVAAPLTSSDTPKLHRTNKHIVKEKKKEKKRNGRKMVAK
jgi:hypothetical protein